MDSTQVLCAILEAVGIHARQASPLPSSHLLDELYGSPHNWGEPLTFQELNSSSHLHPNQQAQLPEEGGGETTPGIPRVHMPCSKDASTLDDHQFSRIPTTALLTQCPGRQGRSEVPSEGSATWSLESCL